MSVKNAEKEILPENSEIKMQNLSKKMNMENEKNS